MDEKEFCRKIMGIVEPWVIGRIQTSEEKRRVDVYLEYPAELSAVCPVCGKAAPLYDKREERGFLSRQRYATVLTGTDTGIGRGGKPRQGGRQRGI